MLKDQCPNYTRNRPMQTQAVHHTAEQVNEKQLYLSAVGVDNYRLSTKISGSLKFIIMVDK